MVLFVLLIKMKIKSQVAERTAAQVELDLIDAVSELNEESVKVQTIIVS